MTEQTLQQLLAQRVSEYAASDRPRELIDAGIDKMFKDVVDDTFRSYGDFSKAIKEAVKDALPANVSDMFELTRYNALVAESLRQRWQAAAVSETLMVKANAAIDEVLKNDFVSGEVSLRALLEAFIERNKEEAAEEHWERTAPSALASSCISTSTLSRRRAIAPGFPAGPAAATMS